MESFLRTSALISRRWFERHEGTIAPVRERILVVFLGYAVGGLGYIAVNRLVGERAFHRLGLPIDEWIPFVPACVFAYVLVYFVPACVAILVRDRAELYRALLAFIIGSVFCFPIFIVFPVEYPRTEVIPASVAGMVLQLVHMLDRPVNCFPSHHVATAFTTFLAIRRQDRRWGALFGAIAGLIAISTLFVKQHYFLDIPAGIAVSVLAYCIAFPSRNPSPR